MAIETPKVFQHNVDIAIIGAGPTGLFTALLARKLGLSVCIVDQANGPLAVGRADALNARTQQVLDVAGVLSELLPQGLKCNTSSTFKDGEFRSRQSHWWTSLQNTQYREFLMIGQPEVERALINAIDCPVLYNIEVKSVEDGPDTVTTNCADLIIKSKYTVAADGAHSSIRKKLGIKFQGEKPNMRWAVLDSFLKTDFPVCNEIISFEKGGQARVAWIPRERGMSRFYVLLDGEVTQAKAEESIRAHMAPYCVEFERTEWFSTFDVQERVAETFVSKDHGRILLAGDAAHVHSVNGGQGLNTGISDAFALAWRLNMACKAMIPGILRSYDQERRTTAQGVVDVAAKLVRSTMRTAEEYVNIVEKSAANITGMGIIYTPETPFVVSGQVGEFIAGFRCPDFEVSQADGRSTFFYNLFEYGKFVILIPSSLKFELDPRASPYVVIWKTSRDSLGEGFKVVTEREVVITTRFDLGQRGEVTIVVRPDLYVGYAGVDANDYFKGIFA